MEPELAIKLAKEAKTFENRSAIQAAPKKRENQMTDGVLLWAILKYLFTTDEYYMRKETYTLYLLH